jgi:ABC-type dipeptide/oligopeptide/nickel transport system permease subunit
LLIFVFGSLFAPLLAPYNWKATNVGPRLSAPSLEHLFGTDLHGRDVFSRMLYGGRYSLSVGIATVLFSMLAGSLFGILVAHFGGRIDHFGVLAIDVMLGFPPIVLAILIVAVLGVGLSNVVVAVGIAGIPRFARVVRGAALAIKSRPYLEATQALGVGNWRVMLRHLLPNVLPTITVLATLNLASAIISTASLSFLGLGAQPPTPEWGAMLNDSREYMRHAPWTMIFPGLALFLSVMSVNLLGDRLSEILDPRVSRGK